MNGLVRGVAALAVAVVLSWSRPVEACGCFAPPNAAEPIVQAGERILFAVNNGKVTAHIQIQYAGDARDFGWLLPLPSVPTLELGSDELFTRLSATTQPQYLVQSVPGTACARPSGGFMLGCASPSLSGGKSFESQDAGTATPLVITSSIGPYDYAVLRADDKTAMLQWLADNRYFVPAGTDSAVGPYINPGAYFLALKLKAGAATGDVTPVVLEYPSSLPMIPIILTSVGAQLNMGVQVWLLGNGRGIPRNYHHVVLNDALLDWMNGAKNYSELVTQAVAEAPGKHAFVTEYAGTSAVMQDQLAPPGRFGTEADLAQAATPQDFVTALLANRFANDDSQNPPVLPSPVIRLLLAQIPYPAALAAHGVDENGFLTHLGYYLGDYRTQHPAEYPGYLLAFDAPTLAQQIFEKYVTPMREANALFAQFPTLTRLFTTLSPQDMTADPVFSFNPELPEVKREHHASLIMDCGSSHLVTEQGWIIQDVTSGGAPPAVSGTPVALRVEVLGEEGPATLVTDHAGGVHERFTNTADPPADAPKTGCTTVDPMSLGLLALMASLRRRRGVGPRP